jgi:hypothetical protein
MALIGSWDEDFQHINVVIVVQPITVQMCENKYTQPSPSQSRTYNSCERFIEALSGVDELFHKSWLEAFGFPFHDSSFNNAW